MKCKVCGANIDHGIVGTLYWTRRDKEGAFIDETGQSFTFMCFECFFRSTGLSKIYNVQELTDEYK